MIYYARITSNNTTDTAKEAFRVFGVEQNDITFDLSLEHRSTDSLYQRLKNVLTETGEVFVVDTLKSLGKNNREISKELLWFLEHRINLVVATLPATHHQSPDSLQLLVELYGQLADAEINNVKEQQKLGIARARAQNLPLGRKRIPYPANWQAVYARWERKEISVSEFMALTGLKKGTLYNLIKQHKESLAIQKQA